ncbi:MAG: hypothetical protein PUB24_00760 [Lachnospiraceae bacterium]|nr:hypothetical protein [Lachnospiraceae bacterium]
MDSGISSVLSTQYVEKVIKKAEKNQDGFSELIHPPGRDMNGKRAPYEDLAVDGIISYNGTTFVCDRDKNQLRLGNTADKNNCLNIPLSGGGNLIVNKDNLEDLANAIDMFNPKDQYLIMRALMEYKKIQEIKGEIEESDSIMIGGRSYTQKEWDLMVEQFDEAEEEMQKQADIAEEEAIEKAVRESDIHIAYERMTCARRDKEEENSTW